MYHRRRVTPPGSHVLSLIFLSLFYKLVCGAVAARNPPPSSFLAPLALLLYLAPGIARAGDFALPWLVVAMAPGPRCPAVQRRRAD